MTRRKIPITERALLQRINRKLDEKDEKVHKARGMVKQQCDFYRLNTSTNTVMKYMTRDDFEQFGPQNGCDPQIRNPRSLKERRMAKRRDKGEGSVYQRPG